MQIHVLATTISGTILPFFKDLACVKSPHMALFFPFNSSIESSNIWGNTLAGRIFCRHFSTLKLPSVNSPQKFVKTPSGTSGNYTHYYLPI